MPTRKNTVQKTYGLLRLLPLVCGLIPTKVAAASITFPTSLATDLAQLMSMVIGILHMFTWIVFIFLNTVLDPRFIFDLDADGGGSLLTLLNQVWILARDLVNIAFAVILVGAAVTVIITQKKEFITSYWSKFVMAVILINFSWFFPRVIIDVSNVAAATIYSIPSLIGSENCAILSSKEISGSQCTNIGQNQFSCQCSHVTNVAFFLNKTEYPKYITPAAEQDGWECKLGSVLCIQKKPLDADSVAGYSYILNGLIVNHARLQTLASLPPPVVGTGTSFIVVMRFALIVLLHIMLFFPLLAMLIAFLMRIPVLWFTMAFMPFVFLKFVLPSKYLGEFPDKLWDYFLKAAFLPAMVAIPLCIGFIMINAGSSIPAPALQGVSINLFDDISSYWQILWLLMSIGVIWVGVFMMLEKAGKMAFGAEGIKSFGERVGKIAVKAPLSIPTIPGLGTSILGLDDMLRNNTSGLEAGLSRGDKFTDLLSQMKNGTLAQSGKINTNAKLLAPNDALQKEINQHLKEIARHTSAGTTNLASNEIDKLNKKLKDAKVDIKIKRDKPEDVVSQLKPYLKPLRDNGADATDVTDMETQLTAIENAIKTNPAPGTP